MDSVYNLTEKIDSTWSIKAVSAAISGHRFVTSEGAAASSGGRALGVSLIDIEAGQDLSVCTEGIVRVMAAGSIAKDVFVQADTGGLGKAVTIAAGQALGLALSTGAADELVLIKIL